MWHKNQSSQHRRFEPMDNGGDNVKSHYGLKLRSSLLTFTLFVEGGVTAADAAIVVVARASLVNAAFLRGRERERRERNAFKSRTCHRSANTRLKSRRKTTWKRPRFPTAVRKKTQNDSCWNVTFHLILPVITQTNHTLTLILENGTAQSFSSVFFFFF